MKAAGSQIKNWGGGKELKKMISFFNSPLVKPLKSSLQTLVPKSQKGQCCPGTCWQLCNWRYYWCWCGRYDSLFLPAVLLCTVIFCSVLSCIHKLTLHVVLQDVLKPSAQTWVPMYWEMSGGKGAKRTDSGSAVKKTTFSDDTNHATVSLLRKKEDSSRWVSTLVPLTVLTAASIHAAKLNENRMLYKVSDATKAQIMVYYLTQIKGQTLDILWGFLLSKFLTTVIFGILSTGGNPAASWLHHTVGFLFFTTTTFKDLVYRQSSSHWQRLRVSSYREFFLFYHEPYQPQRINKVGVSC